MSELAKSLQDAAALKPGMPIPKSTADSLEYIRTRTFEFWYRNKFKPQCAFVLCDSLQDARTRCEQYCGRFGLKFISVKPYYLDLDKLPQDDSETA